MGRVNTSAIDPAHSCPSGDIRGGFVELRDLARMYGSLAAVEALTLSIGRGEFFSLLGPSGCGKTTTLRLIAGLDRPSRGRIDLDGRPVSGPESFVPPERRGVGVVFQDYALFPHMTVFQNVAFGLYRQSRDCVRERVRELLDLVGLAGSVARYPHELSGGQRQRVALARALAPAPCVMLLDEPFSNLDAELRTSIRTETKDILKASGTTVILVTHDQEEAFSLSDRVGLLNLGRLEQVGTPYEIYHRPSSRFVASFAGRVDFVPARVEGGAVVTAFGTFPLGGDAPVPDSCVDLMIRPDDVALSPDPGSGTVITGMEFLGAHALYTLRLAGGEVLHSHGLSSNLLAAGTRVRVNVTLRHTVLFS
ncbi:MAG TPA: ABC transporter ATP-binding protein [Magnetospirillaceae bacterium]|nr:ABC transporter ATP-binding protein [Magnetospirillaceae bacterium]